MSPLHFHYRLYSLPLREPLLTAHGRWERREGIVVQLSDGHGGVGYGEMAPIPWFGTETLDDCHELCRALGPVVEVDEVREAALPCARFALGTALAMLRGERPARARYPVAVLLPAGAAALNALEARLGDGCTTFKTKVVTGSRDELRRVEALLERLEASGGRLRVDANGCLGGPGAEPGLWLDTLARYPAALEFLEQPLPAGREDEMRRLLVSSGVPLALDESVAGPDSLMRHIDWPGVLVIKPALAGDPLELRRLLAPLRGRVVFSSALETAIGVYGALLAAGDELRPLGFGVDCWPPGDTCHAAVTAGHLDVEALAADYLANVWSHTGSSSVPG